MDWIWLLIILLGIPFALAVWQYSSSWNDWPTYGQKYNPPDWYSEEGNNES